MCKKFWKNIIDKDPLDWAGECYKRGAGEIVLTSIDKDGLMEGYDNYLINQISSKINIPIIASGGAGNYNHMFEALRSGPQQ